MPNDALAWRRVDDGLVLHIALIPKSSRDEIGEVVKSVSGYALRVKVRALPDKGYANQAVIKLLSKWLGTPKTSFVLVSGSRSRYKTIKIIGSFEKIAKVLETRLQRGETA